MRGGVMINKKADTSAVISEGAEGHREDKQPGTEGRGP